jgi:hypothetical protein
MLYKKNVGALERLGRGLLGGAMAASPLLLDLPPLAGRGLIVGGLFTIVTGMIGYCPACAAIGRRPLPESEHAR